MLSKTVKKPNFFVFHIFLACKVCGMLYQVNIHNTDVFVETPGYHIYANVSSQKNIKINIQVMNDLQTKNAYTSGSYCTTSNT